MLKKITRLEKVREIKFLEVDNFRQKERKIRDDIIFCEHNIEILKNKLDQIDTQHRDFRSGSDLQHAFQMRVKLELALDGENDRKRNLVEKHKVAKTELNKKLAEDNAFGKLIDKRNRTYKENVEKQLTQL